MMIAAQEGKILPSHLSSDPTLRQRFERPDGRQPLSLPDYGRVARNPLATGREFSMNPQIPSGERVFLDSENKLGSGDQFA
jgi:hypothetical protein